MNNNSCSEEGCRGKFHSILQYVFFPLLFIVISQNVSAVQISGSISMPATDSNLEAGQIFSVSLIANNNSTEDLGEPGNGAAVPSRILAGSVLTYVLACDDPACALANELGGTLHFQNSGINGCLSSEPEVLSCEEDAGNPNHVLITFGSDFVIGTAPKSREFATVRLQAVNAVLSPSTGEFFQAIDSGPADFYTQSIVDPAQEVFDDINGNRSFFFPGVCDVQVDKQISCDGGATWVDQGLVDADDDGANPCSTAEPNEVRVRYQVHNSGDFELTQCTLGESNAAFGDPTDPGPIAPGETTPFIPGELVPQCRNADDGEPDTAEVNCICAAFDPVVDVTATDRANLACQPVDLLVDRAPNCGDGLADNLLVAANDDGTNGCTAPDGAPVNWEYCTRNNSPNVPLYACTLVDQNPLVSPNPILVGDLAPLAENCNIPATNTVDCSDVLEASEAPDAGRVDLACCTVDVASIDQCPEDGRRVQVFDVSTVTCETPGLELDKQCIPRDDDSGINDIVITATNTGEVNLVDCQLTDTIYLEDESCADPVVGPGTPIDVAPDHYDLPTGVVGNPIVSQGVTGDLDADACNKAHLVCLVEGTGQPIPADASAVCPGEPDREGCLTRTAGFWGNHPFLIPDPEVSGDERSLDLLPLEVCGTVINTTNYGSEFSTTEAICSVGKDGKIQGSQETQLIRQCTAAWLNIAATNELEGSCFNDYAGLAALMDECCSADSVCTDPAADNDTLGSCIERVDMFNNDPFDTLNFPFNTGPADSSICRKSKNNGTVVYPGQGEE